MEIIRRTVDKRRNLTYRAYLDKSNKRETLFEWLVY